MTGLPGCCAGGWECGSHLPFLANRLARQKRQRAAALPNLAEYFQQVFKIFATSCLGTLAENSAQKTGDNWLQTGENVAGRGWRKV